MPKDQEVSRGDERWAHFRFSVIGSLFSAPPQSGELKSEIEALSKKTWQHPITKRPVKFSVPTIERWYYLAASETNDPVMVLARKIREDHGTHPSLSNELRTELFRQYGQHPGWSCRLHADNLAELVKKDSRLGSMPSYPSVRRFMKAHGLVKRRRLGRGHTAGVESAENRFEHFEIRSYESEYVNALWHLDFHHGSLKVLMPNGQWSGVHILGVLDDHSRLCCHAQWYLAETAENLVHGLSQGFEKRGLPRALLTDNGSAMIAAETEQGLQRLGIVHETTLPYSAYQNGKQEVFWAQVEGRLLAMLEGVKDLTLANLNEATLAWIEMEYNRKVHSELGQTPIARFVSVKDVGRPCPTSEALRMAFTAKVCRTQRRSDGTLSLDGLRFELPSRFRHLNRVSLRYAAWDLSCVYLADPRSGQILARVYPLEKHKNADARRRRMEPIGPITDPNPETSTDSGGVAPLLRKLIADYAATGLPPAYLPKDEITGPKEPKR